VEHSRVSERKADEYIETQTKSRENGKIKTKQQEIERNCLGGVVI
jgi:hypothetical protein